MFMGRVVGQMSVIRNALFGLAGGGADAHIMSRNIVRFAFGASLCAKERLIDNVGRARCKLA